MLNTPMTLTHSDLKIKIRLHIYGIVNKNDNIKIFCSLTQTAILFIYFLDCGYIPLTQT